MNPTALVDVKSAWWSKVNWAAALTGLATVSAALLPIVPAKYQAEAAAIVAAIGTITTIILKTFYTTSVTPSSAAKVE